MVCTHPQNKPLRNSQPNKRTYTLSILIQITVSFKKEVGLWLINIILHENIGA